jgi:glycosyltransferase involved in cell wall biosynthesis
MITVAWIFRKPLSFYFSIEKVFALVEKKLKPEVINIKRVYMPRHRITPATFLHNFKTTRNVTADIYHVTGDVHYIVLVLPRRKTILTIHDCIFMHQSKGLKRLIISYLFLKLPVAKSRVVTTVSEKSRQDIINYTGCSPAKVRVISDPFDERFSFQPYTFNTICPVLLFVGITPNKNLARVIEALKGLTCQLHIIGKIPEVERELLKKANINYRESFRISDDELREVYKNADIVLFPSLFEGFGLPIIEAQQTGRPVITSNLSPMKEVAGGAACLVDPFSVQSIRNGIIKVIQDEQYRNEIIAKGEINAKKYNPEVIAKEYFNLYTEITSGN